MADKNIVEAGSSEDGGSSDMQQCSGATVNSFVKAESSKCNESSDNELIAEENNQAAGMPS